MRITIFFLLFSKIPLIFCQRWSPRSCDEKNQLGNFFSSDYHPLNRPGSRLFSSSARLGDKLVLYGGLGFGLGENKSLTFPRYLSDMWHFDLKKQQWKLVKGNAESSSCPIYRNSEEIKHFGDHVTPGGRVDSLVMKKSEKEFVLFGGMGCLNTGNPKNERNMLNDVFLYNIEKNQWQTIVQYETAGGNACTKEGIEDDFGSFGIPGSREGGVGIKMYDTKFSKYFVGFGRGCYKYSESKPQVGCLNDIFILDIGQGKWAWSGLGYTGQKDTMNVYGVQNVLNSGGVIGCRINPSSWRHRRNIMIFGGMSHDYFSMNDLWSVFLPYSGNKMQVKWIGGTYHGSLDEIDENVVNERYPLRRRITKAQVFDIGQVFIYGGSIEHNYMSNDIWIYKHFYNNSVSYDCNVTGCYTDESDGEWVLVNPKGWRYYGNIKSESSKFPVVCSSFASYADPGGRAGHSIFEYNDGDENQIYIFGGSDFWESEFDFNAFNGLWVYPGSFFPSGLVTVIITSSIFLCFVLLILIFSLLLIIFLLMKIRKVSNDGKKDVKLMTQTSSMSKIDILKKYKNGKLNNSTPTNEDIEEVRLFEKMYETNSEDVEFVTFKKRLFENYPDILKKINIINYSDITLESFLSTGGSTASVFKGNYKQNEIAYKSFPLKLDLDVDDYSDFAKETAIYFSADHPNVLKVFGVVMSRKHMGLVMKYCAFGDLRTFIQTQRPSMKLRMDILFGIAKAMHYLHTFNDPPLLHRDLKLLNVLVDENLQPQLMDFGLSRIFNKTISVKTINLGTESFVAPEVVLGDGKYGKKADVFSFAILSFCLLSGNLCPFGKQSKYSEGNLNLSIAKDNLRPNIEEISFTEGNMWMKNIIINCWDSDPNKRMEFFEICAEFKKHNFLINEEITIYIKEKNNEEKDADDVELSTFSIKGLKELIVKEWNLKERNLSVGEFEMHNSGKKIETDFDVKNLQKDSIIVVNLISL